MDSFDIYKDISERTNGDIYLGVVGPVRTGKSTFIKNFMDELILPNIENSYNKERAKDELPQSASGNTIMTTEPKFVPAEAVEVALDKNVNFKVRLVDCVGYLVEGATGHLDGEEPRMINTPWSEDKIPFAQAAEIGTQKVINDHATIGVVITTDGTITDIPRESYLESEERVIGELKAIGKPFVLLLNTARPFAHETEELRHELADKYGVTVVATNVAQLKREDINTIMEKVLYEFPVKELKINLPRWIETLPTNHWLKQSLIGSVKNMLSDGTNKLAELQGSVAYLENNDYVKKAYLDNLALGQGTARIEVALGEKLFYQIISETTSMDIDSDYKLISTIKVLAEAKTEYDKIKYALEEVKQKGYGIVMPDTQGMKLEAPVLVKHHGNKYGVKIKATAPSFHLIKADIETEVSQIVGTEEESQDLINYISTQMQEDPDKVWEMNTTIGRSMHDQVSGGLKSKLYNIPEDAQMKFQDALQRIINEGSGGLICIIL